MTNFTSKISTRELKSLLVKKYGHKFSVTKQTGSSYIRIDWTDGATYDDVSNFVNVYNDDSRDDLQSDYWAGTQYVLCQRDISIDAFKYAAQRTCEQYNLNFKALKFNDKYVCLKDDFYVENFQCYMGNLIFRKASKIDYRTEDTKAMSDRYICAKCNTIHEQNQTGGYNHNGDVYCWECYDIITAPERKEKEKQDTIAAAAHKEKEEITKAIHPLSIVIEDIENQKTIKLFEPEYNKCNDIQEVLSLNLTETPARVAETIIINNKAYDFFINNLLWDYNFLAGKGGHDAEDVGNGNYHFNYNIFLKITNEAGNKTIYVNPEGHNYARYVALPAEDAEDNTKLTETIINDITDNQDEKNILFAAIELGIMNHTEMKKIGDIEKIISEILEIAYSNKHHTPEQHRKICSLFDLNAKNKADKLEMLTKKEDQKTQSNQKSYKQGNVIFANFQSKAA